MKRLAIVLLLICFNLVLLFSSVSGRISMAEELSYLKYNKTWDSPSNIYYSVESIASNPKVECGLDLIIGKGYGIALGVEFGYQQSIYDKNRFSSFPKNLNASILTGVVFASDICRVSLSGLLRSSFQTIRNNWITQMGGVFDLSYVYDFGLFFGLSFNYLYCYEMTTASLSLGLGYRFGEKR